ncbi:MAG: YnbE family lipoprotein [Alphaproteobacteria bacterium]
MTKNRAAQHWSAFSLAVLLSAACTPTVQLQAPEKPIEINLNVNIEQRIKVEIAKDVRQAMAKNKSIF